MPITERETEHNQSDAEEIIYKDFESSKTIISSSYQLISAPPPESKNSALTVHNSTQNSPVPATLHQQQCTGVNPAASAHNWHYSGYVTNTA